MQRMKLRRARMSGTITPGWVQGEMLLPELMPNWKRV